MSSSKEAVIVVVISFLAVILICSLVSMPIVFAAVKKGPISCNPVGKGGGAPGGAGLILCCQTTTDSEGIETTKCTTCDDTQPPSNCGTPFNPDFPPPASDRGTAQPPSTPPPSNETHVNNLPGNIGTAQSPSTPPPSLNAIPPPSAFPSPTKQQTLTTTCPNGLAPDANGNCPTPTTNTNQQGGLTSNNNNNPQQGHHHKGSNQPTQTGGGGQELTATKKHKGPKTDQGATQPTS
jgi:hypothetical protein